MLSSNSTEFKVLIKCLGLDYSKHSTCKSSITFITILYSNFIYSCFADEETGLRQVSNSLKMTQIANDEALCQSTSDLRI